MIFVDTDKCIGCERCAMVCPVRVFVMNNEQKSEFYRKSFCIHCGHCINVCPVEALSSDFHESEKGIPVSRLKMPSFDQVESLMLTRRSIRAYDKKPVKKEKIERLLRLAAHAPTARNAQDVSFIVVGPDKGAELGRLADNYWKRQLNENIGVITREAGFEILLGAPATVALYADKRCDGEMNEALWNCIVEAQNLLLAAHGMGLGGCYNGLLLNAYRNDKDLQKFFRMPDDKQIYMFVEIGYIHPNIEYLNTIERVKPRITWL